MSETETDYDDEDLSAPPKKTNGERTVPSNAPSVSVSVTVTDDDGDTGDDDIQEISNDQFQSIHNKRKREDISSTSNKSPITARRSEEGAPRILSPYINSQMATN